MRGRWLGIAVVLHGAAIAALCMLPSAPRAAAPAVLESIELDVTPMPAAETAPATAPIADHGPPTAEPEPAATNEPAPTREAARSPAPTPAAAPAEPAPNADVQVLATRPDIGLGKSSFMMPGTLPEGGAPLAAEGRAPSRDRNGAEASMWRVARDRDTELGLGPEGPVLHALGDTTRTSFAPNRGHAVFLAKADESGTVVSITVVRYSGKLAGWKDAAERALADLEGTKLRLPSTAKGAELLVDITSDVRLPSGHHPGVNVNVLGIPLAEGEGEDSTRIDILPLLPKIVMVPLTTDGSDALKIPLPSISFTILGVGGDPVDIGAKPARIVHSRLLGSRVL